MLWAHSSGIIRLGNANFGTRITGNVGWGSDPSASNAFVFSGSVNPGSGNALVANFASTLIPGSGASAVFMQAGGAVNTQTSNTISAAYSAYLAAPAKTGTGVITDAYCLFAEEPSSGTNNTSIRAAGRVVFDKDASVGNLRRGAPITKIADFTVGANENWLMVNKAASPCIVTLPTPASSPGREITIKTLKSQTVLSASSNVVRLTGGSAGTAILSNVSSRWATIVSDGTNWVIVAAA